MGTALLPSVKASKLTSLPVRHSSIITLSPEAPKILASIISDSALEASSLVLATVTPFPAASPSALTTSGIGLESMYFLASL